MAAGEFDPRWKLKHPPAHPASWNIKDLTALQSLICCCFGAGPRGAQIPQVSPSAAGEASEQVAAALFFEFSFIFFKLAAIC